MYLLIEVFEFSSGIAQPELALDPNGQAENIGEEQKAIEEDSAPVFVPEQGAPADEETQLAHEGKRQRQKNDNCDKDCVSQHGNSNQPPITSSEEKWRGRRRRGAASPKGSRPLERPLILGRPGIELVLGRGLFGAVELQDRVSPHLPRAALYVLVVLVGIFTAAQLAFDEQ